MTLNELKNHVLAGGHITPDEALKEAAVILKHHIDVFDKVNEEDIEFETVGKEVSEEQNRLRKLLKASFGKFIYYRINSLIRSRRGFYKFKQFFSTCHF